jgi:hypothetical protein
VVHCAGRLFSESCRARPLSPGRRHGSDCQIVTPETLAPETWVKLSRGFDMGQIVILLNMGQIVIFFLVPTLFFFAWEFPAAGA